MIEKSKEYPEHLGVGKPYDVDTRIQDYLTVFCLDKLNRKSETEPLKKSISEFKVSNSGPSYSNILTVNMLRKMGGNVAADKVVRELAGSKNPVQKWVYAVAGNDQTAIADIEKGVGSDVNLQIIKKVLEVTK